MNKRDRVLLVKEKKALNRFLSLEIPKQIEIDYPPQKVQNIFKLKQNSNESSIRMRKKKYKKG